MKIEQENLGFDEEIYLDANVFIYAVLDEGLFGDCARNLIGAIKKGDHKAYTSTLTIDELLWKVQKVLGKETAVDAVKNFLSMIHLELVAVDHVIIKNSLVFYLKENLDPRDAIHLACMHLKKLKKIVSSDSDFDKIKDIHRVDFTKL